MRWGGGNRDEEGLVRAGSGEGDVRSVHRNGEGGEGRQEGGRQGRGVGN